jgi:hypothetical protein
VSQQFQDQFPPAISTTRAGDGAVSQDEDPAEIQRRPRQVHNHFSQERQLVSREIYKQRRSAALAEWWSIMG